MLAAVLLCCATQLEATGQDASQYVRGLVANQRSTEAALKSYVYDLTELREELDRHGRVTGRRMLRFQVFHVRDRPVRRLVEVDDEPLPAFRQRDEDARVRRRIAEIRSGRAEAARPGLSLSAVLERYRFEAMGREEVRGRCARVFDFRTPPDEVEEDDVVDDVLETLAGRIWVDEADRQVVRAQVYSETGEPIELGALGSLSELGFELSYRKRDGGVWLPSSLRTYVSGRRMINRYHRRRTLMYEHFRHPEVDAIESLRF
jgi:hypothetical protein